jgi:hypothetical protein
MLRSIGEVETLADDAREVQDLGDEHPVIPALENKLHGSAACLPRIARQA